jgi:hypothetical protein
VPHLGCQCSKELKAAIVKQSRIYGATESHTIRVGMSMFLQSVGAIKGPPNPIMLQTRRKKIKRTPFTRIVRKVQLIHCDHCSATFADKYFDDLGIDQNICPGCGHEAKAA